MHYVKNSQPLGPHSQKTGKNHPFCHFWPKITFFGHNFSAIWPTTMGHTPLESARQTGSDDGCPELYKWKSVQPQLNQVVLRKAATSALWRDNGSSESQHYCTTLIEETILGGVLLHSKSCQTNVRWQKWPKTRFLWLWQISKVELSCGTWWSEVVWTLLGIFEIWMPRFKVRLGFKALVREKKCCRINNFR